MPIVSASRGVSRVCIGAVVVLIAMTALLTCARDARAADARPWTQLGGTLSVSPTTHSWQADGVVTSTGTVWTAWEEGWGINARSWNGSTWSAVQQVSGPSTTQYGVDMTLVNDQPWVIYAFNNGTYYEARVKRWNGSSWVQVGGGLNNYSFNAESLRIVTVDAASVYVSFTELGVVTIKKLTNTGAVTDLIGASGADPFDECSTNTVQRADIAVVAGAPWAVVRSGDCSSPNTKARIQAWRWTSGTSWVKVGARIDPSSPEADSTEARIKTNGTATGTYIAWADWIGPDVNEDYQLNVRRWNGSSWVTMSPPVTSVTNETPHMAVTAAGQLWLAETDDGTAPHMFLFHWDGSSWRRYWYDVADQNYNFHGEAELALDTSGRPISFLRESVAGYYQIYVRRFEPNVSLVGDVADVRVATLSSTSVQLSWTNPSDASIASVNIYRATTPGVRGTLVQTVSAPTTTWTDTGLTANTTYYYTLVAADATGLERGNTFETPRAVLPGVWGANVETDGTRAWWVGYDDTRSDAYDPATDLMTTNGALSVRRTRAASTWVPTSNRMILAGGLRSGAVSSAITTFDPSAGTESAVVASLPAARSYAAGAYSPVTGKMYVFGGENAAETVAYSSIYEYDPVTHAVADTGVQLPAPASRSVALYWPEDACIYVLGGRPTDAGSGGANKNVRLSSVVRFCPAMNARPASVATVGSLATGIGEFGAFATDNEFVIVGGSPGWNLYSKEISTWSPRYGGAARASFELRNARIGRSPTATLGTSDRGLFASTYPAISTEALYRRMVQINSAPIVSVRTSANAPATPSMATPAAGAAVSTHPSFSASAFSDVDAGSAHRSTEWEVSSGSTCASVVYRRIGSADLTSMDLDAATLAQGNHSVRVRYADNGMRWSSWSACRSFVVDATAPAPPPLGAPDDGAYSTLQPTLVATVSDTGGSATGTVTFQVCADATCSTIEQSITSAATSIGQDASWVLPTPLVSGTTRYWRARTTDAVGNVGPWSATRTIYPITVTVTSTTRGAGNAIPVGSPNITVDVNGANFQPGASASISGAGVTIVSQSRLSSSVVRLVLDVSSGAAIGARDVTIMNPTTPAPGGTSGVGTGVLVLKAASMTITAAARSYDGSVDSSPTPALSFGTFVPGGSREIGTGVGGPAQPAVELGVTSDVPYDVTASFLAFTGPEPLPLTSLSIRTHAPVGTWVDAASAATLVSGHAADAPSGSSFGFDMRLVTPAQQKVGVYATTLTMLVAPTI